MTGAGAAVDFLRWPQDVSALHRSRREQRPRLLLVAPGQEPPPAADPLEDWVLLPAGQAEVDARAARLSARHSRFDRPSLRGRVLSYRGRGLTLSPTQTLLLTRLLEAEGGLVLRRSLQEALGAGSGRNALDLQMARLRRRIGTLGLGVETVWGSGYALTLP